MMNNTEWTKQELAVLQKLKNKETAKAFGRCSAEERAMFAKVGKANCLLFNGAGWTQAGEGIFVRAYEYVIKPDFQPPEPEPEFVDCPIRVRKDGFGADTNWLVFDRNTYMTGISINNATGMVGFQGFFSLTRTFQTTDIPGTANCWLQQGHEMVVRFKR